MDQRVWMCWLSAMEIAQLLLRMRREVSLSLHAGAIQVTECSTPGVGLLPGKSRAQHIRPGDGVGLHGRKTNYLRTMSSLPVEWTAFTDESLYAASQWGSWRAILPSLRNPD